jgi:hypothetical protein
MPPAAAVAAPAAGEAGADGNQRAAGPNILGTIARMAFMW